MSPAMKKPERVEVGQWWAWCNQRGPKRIETIRMYSGRLEAEYGNGHGSVVCQWLIENGEYLGSGDHPEPSERMIETLVDAMSEIENGGPAFDEPSRGRFDRTNYRRIVRDAIDGKSHDLTYTRCVGVVYRLLRSLGKW